LSLLPEEAVPFIAGFLRVKSEEVRGEAVAALAQSREPAALEQLIALWRERLTQDMRAAVLLSLAGSPLPPAAEFLLDILNQESGDVAKTAITALARSRFHAEFHERVRAATVGKQDPQLERHFAQEFAL